MCELSPFGFQIAVVSLSICMITIIIYFAINLKLLGRNIISIDFLILIGVCLYIVLINLEFIIFNKKLLYFIVCEIYTLAKLFLLFRLNEVYIRIKKQIDRKFDLKKHYILKRMKRIFWTLFTFCIVVFVICLIFYKLKSTSQKYKTQIITTFVSLTQICILSIFFFLAIKLRRQLKSIEVKILSTNPQHKSTLVRKLILSNNMQMNILITVFIGNQLFLGLLNFLYPEAINHNCFDLYLKTFIYLVIISQAPLIAWLAKLHCVIETKVYHFEKQQQQIFNSQIDGHSYCKANSNFE